MPTFALILWPFISVAIFAGLGPQRGIIWSVVIGYLFLPSGFVLNPPGLPGYDRVTAISIGVLLGVLVTRSRLPADEKRTDRSVLFLFAGLLVLLAVGPLITTMANRAPVFFGPTMRQGMTLWDVQSVLIPLFVSLVPWFVARRHLHKPEMHAEILRAMVIVGLFYTLLALFELRMSPQINNMFYGYFPHSWLQHIRGGGFRPLVFLDHGLSLGFYMMAILLAAVALIWTYRKEKRAFFMMSAIWIFLVLAISRNLGAFALALVFLPVALALSKRMQIRVAAIIALVFMLNPLIRDAYVQPLLAAAQVVSQHRHDSLKTRFDNEQAMLDRLNQKPITGWGEWSRWRIHDEFGRDVTISDGTWIIVLGKWGWIGFIGFFGMLSAPILLMARAARRREATYATTGMALIMAANLVYLIPNSTLTPISWMIAGALAGFAQFVPAREAAEAPGPEDGAPTSGQARQPVYTRFAKTASPPVPDRRAKRPARTAATVRAPRASGQ